MDSVRTCLGCRQRAPRTSLVRIVARDGRVVVDTAKRLPGRGAWLHPDASCVRNAIRRNAIPRALRAGGVDTTDLTNHFPVPEEQAERHMDN